MPTRRRHSRHKVPRSATNHPIRARPNPLPTTPTPKSPGRYRGACPRLRFPVTRSRQRPSPRADDILIKMRAGLHRSLLRFKVDVDDAEPFRVAEGPFEIVEE